MRRTRRVETSWLCDCASITGAGRALPIYLRTGKHHEPRARPRSPSASSRRRYAPSRTRRLTRLRPNWLVLQIQPAEGIRLQFEVKRPGPVVDLAPARMIFVIATGSRRSRMSAMRPLIYDVMIGDATLFSRADMVESTWRVVQPVLDAWAAEKPRDFPDYASGTDGPDAADALLERDGGRSWRPIKIPDEAAKQVSDRPNIALLLADVDGTLVTQDKVLTPESRAAARELRAAGISLAITSGRPPKGMRMLIEPLALDTVVAGFNGGVFVDAELTILDQRSSIPMRRGRR